MVTRDISNNSAVEDVGNTGDVVTRGEGGYGRAGRCENSHNLSASSYLDEQTNETSSFEDSLPFVDGSEDGEETDEFTDDSFEPDEMNTNVQENIYTEMEHDLSAEITPSAAYTSVDPRPAAQGTTWLYDTEEYNSLTFRVLPDVDGTGNELRSTVNTKDVVSNHEGVMNEYGSLEAHGLESSNNPYNIDSEDIYNVIDAQGTSDGNNVGQEDVKLDESGMRDSENYSSLNFRNFPRVDHTGKDQVSTKTTDCRLSIHEGDINEYGTLEIPALERSNDPFNNGSEDIYNVINAEGASGGNRVGQEDVELDKSGTCDTDEYNSLTFRKVPEIGRTGNKSVSCKTTDCRVPIYEGGVNEYGTLGNNSMERLENPFNNDSESTYSVIDGGGNAPDESNHYAIIDGEIQGSQGLPPEAYEITKL